MTSIIVAVSIFLAMLFAVINYRGVKSSPDGTEKMRTIATAIREGANSFIRFEYKIISVVAIIVAVILGVVIGWYCGVSFFLGAIMSASAGWVGMKIAPSAMCVLPTRRGAARNFRKRLRLPFAAEV